MKTGIHTDTPITYLFWWCEPCNTHHMVPVTGPRAWTWNQDRERPTLSPSVKVTYNFQKEGHQRVPEATCHFWLRNGCVEYCPDSTHSLAGQTVSLVDLP